MVVSHAAHKVYKIKYHIVICIKYRKKMLLSDERISFFKNVLSEIGKRYDLRFDAIGTDGDHVHLFVDAPPKYSPSNIFRIVKSITAREMLTRFPEIKEDLWGGEFWNDGGYVGTVGEGTTAEIVRNYILRQGSKKEKEGYRQFKLTEL